MKRLRRKLISKREWEQQRQAEEAARAALKTKSVAAWKAETNLELQDSHGNNLCASAVQVFRAFPPQSFNPTTTSWWEGRPVVRSPKQLRLHRTQEGLGWTDAIDEFNDAARLKGQSVPEPILITTNGTVLAGFGRWRVALFELRHEIPCIEYPLSEDESLQFILSHHQTRCGWNAQQSANHDRLASRSEGFSALS